MDYNHDATGTRLYAVLQDYDAPNFVKEASAAALRPAAGAPRDLYALPGKGLLPVHTKAAVWLSSAFLAKYGGELTLNERKLADFRLEQHRRLFGLEEPIRQPAEKLAAVQHLLETPSGPRLPVRNAAELKLAAAYLREHRASIPLEARMKAAAVALDLAAAWDVDLGPARPDLERQALQAACFPDELAAAFSKRAVWAKQRERFDEAEALAKTAAELLDAPRHDVLPQEVVADSLLTLDRFDRGVMKGAGCVEDEVMAWTESKLQEAAEAYCPTASGAVYKRADLAQLRLTAIHQIDPRLAEQVADGYRVDTRKLAVALEALDYGPAARMEQLCQEAGIVPVTRQESGNFGFTPEELAALAG